MVKYIEALTSLLESAFSKCLAVVDFERAKIALDAQIHEGIHRSISRRSHAINFDHVFAMLVKEPATTFQTGVWRETRRDMFGITETKFRYVECKGIIHIEEHN